MSESHSAWEAEIAALKARVEELEAESRGLRAHVTPDPDDVEYYMTGRGRGARGRWRLTTKEAEDA